MVYIKKNPNDFQKRGPKVKLPMEHVAEAHRQDALGIQKKRICQNLGISFYQLNRLLELPNVEIVEE